LSSRRNVTSLRRRNKVSNSLPIAPPPAVLKQSSIDFLHPMGGTGPYDPAATRWGDYSWAVLDATTYSVWMATEYMPPLASQTTDRLRNWGTRVLRLSLA
jgi:hypothetical protein